jgi:hypothetical protein
MVEIPAVATFFITAYAVLLAVSAVFLIAVVADALVAQRRVRVARGRSIRTHYFGLTPSH